jgi:hypothetical protein
MTMTDQSVLRQPENRALVHFKNGRTWEFSGDDCLVHKTRYGTEYRLFVELEYFKPIWIGRHAEQDGRHYWFTVESMLGADYIDFGCGGRYYFDKNTIRGRVLRKQKSCTK